MARLCELYLTHSQSVRARCRALLKDATAAEDATQETFLRVQRHIGEMEGVANVRAWILRVATNYCLNEIRNSALLRARPLEFESTASPSQEETLLARDLLRKLLSDLPATQQTLLELHYVYDLEQQHIAGQLGVSRRTVVNRMMDLRHSLQRWQNI
jgi:RNA polymerase sigma-70 factor (ECF subfamily)